MQCKYINKRRILRTVLATMGMLFASSNFGYAKVTGAVCSNCHTMHNSQNATNMQLGSTYQYGPGGVDGCIECHGSTRVALLRLDCLGCHAKAINGASNIIDGWPQVAHNAATDLAGGNYKYVFSDDTVGHNVHGFATLGGPNPIAADSNLGNNPPGYKSDYDPSFGKYQPGQLAGQVMCAGQNGCHGNRDQISPILAMKRTHHADDSMLKFGSLNETQQGGGTGGTSDFTTAGRSYRFLYNVHGAEDANWEGVNPSSTVHNEYRGDPDLGRGQAQGWTDVKTISDLCAECHGKFHAGGISGDSGIGSASPWLRHPTDVVLPASGEYTAYTVYSTEAPIARPQSFFVTGLANADSVVRPGTDIVMCLSCHRAHASRYPDILRWDYSTMIAGGGGSGGCFTCHSKKPTNNP